MALFMKRNGQLVPVRCLNGSLTIKPSQPAPTVDYLCFTAQEANSTVYLSKVGTPYENTVQYSFDKINWVNEDFTTPKTLVNVGDKVYYKGNGDLSKDDNNFYKFVMTGIIGASGNVMTLLDGVGTSTTIAKNYTFMRLFVICEQLTSAPLLPATTLANYCYQYMFNGCTSLTTAPALPAKALANSCYRDMFYGCTSLTTAPSLPATTLKSYCYSGMFRGCTSLTTTPSLPATTLANYCYQYMFNGCTSLTTAPALPATTLANYCYYYMFYGCTSLTSAPSLPATTLANYCYSSMFRGCTSLTTTPSLPATTLADYCYQFMFNVCTSLTTAPSLPATTLATTCYYYMFNGCQSLVVSDTSGTGYTNAWRIPTGGTFTNTYLQSNMFRGCAGTRSSNNMAGEQGQSYTYYTQNAPV